MARLALTRKITRSPSGRRARSRFVAALARALGADCLRPSARTREPPRFPRVFPPYLFAVGARSGGAGADVVRSRALVTASDPRHLAGAVLSTAPRPVAAATRSPSSPAACPRRPAFVRRAVRPTVARIGSDDRRMSRRRGGRRGGVSSTPPPVTAPTRGCGLSPTWLSPARHGGAAGTVPITDSGPIACRPSLRELVFCGDAPATGSFPTRIDIEVGGRRRAVQVTHPCILATFAATSADAQATSPDTLADSGAGRRRGRGWCCGSSAAATGPRVRHDAPNRRGPCALRSVQGRSVLARKAASRGAAVARGHVQLWAPGL